MRLAGLRKRRRPKPPRRQTRSAKYGFPLSSVVFVPIPLGAVEVCGVDACGGDTEVR